MTTPSPTPGALCRDCGAALGALDAGCGDCGAAAPDAQTRLRLQRHLGRLQRARGELRAILAFHLGVGASTRYGPWIVVGFLGLLVVPPVVAAGSFMLLLLGGHEWWAIGAALSALVLQALGFVAALAITYFVATRLQDRSRRRARACAAELAVTRAVRCAGCGGYSAAPALGSVSPLDCPWCDAGLVAGEWENGLAAAGAAIDACRAQLGAGPFERARRRGRRASHVVEVPLAGFDMRAGLMRGAFDGVALWSGHDVGPGGTFVRIEAPSTTRLEHPWWFVRRVGESRLREAAAEWGHVLPIGPATSPLPGVRAYCDADEAPPDLEELRAALARLDPNESLLLEPAGVAVWRHLPSLLMRAWAPLLRHHDTVAALARALGAAPLSGRAPVRRPAAAP